MTFCKSVMCRFESDRRLWALNPDLQVFWHFKKIGCMGVLRLDKPRNNVVWKGEVPHAKIEKQIAQNVQRPKSCDFVAQREEILS